MRYLFEHFSLDTDRRELCRGTGVVHLAPQVFDLLEYLIRNRERVISKDDLIAVIWNGRSVSDSALTTRINAARSAIGDNGEDQRLIKTLPRKGFRFAGEVREVGDPQSTVAAKSGAQHAASDPGLPLPNRPSIAVLPFVNLSGNPKQEYFADGIVEDIITELSRFAELFVIARNSSFQYKGRAIDVRRVARELGVRYVLEGSVRRGGNRIRISAQLIDATTGVHRWAERYDREIKHVFAVQDDVVRTIVSILAAHVTKTETERSRARAPATWQGYDYYLQARHAFGSFGPPSSVEHVYEARRYLTRLLAMDGNDARALALLANTYTAAWVNPWDGDFLNPAAFDKAYELARKAVQLDLNLPEAHGALGTVLIWKHQHETSLAEFERAIKLNPNYSDWRFGLALVYAGSSRRAIEVLEAYMRLDPFYAPLASAALGFAHYMLGDYPQALKMLCDYVSRAPGFLAGHARLAATYARLEKFEEARAEAAQVLRLHPAWTIEASGKPLSPFKYPRDADHYFDGLRKAGLPVK